jgi:hypothetical protein
MLENGRISTIRPTPTPEAQPVKPTNSSTTVKPNKTSHERRPGFGPTLPVTIPQKRTMEETARRACSMEENIRKIIDAAKESPAVAERSGGRLLHVSHASTPPFRQKQRR